MLGKLMKYEWKSTWKLLVPANLLIIVMTFFACVTVKIDPFRYDASANVEMAGVMIILAYFLSMFVALVGSAIYLIYHFYTSTYGDQGYLLHTLPVDKHHIIIAKVTVSAVWVLISMFLMYMSLIFLFVEEGKILSERYIEDFKAAVTGAFFTGSGGIDMSTFAFIMTLIALIVEMFARVLKVTACISLGQLSSNHKLLTAIAFYFAIYIVQQIVNGFYYVFLGYLARKTGSWRFGGSWEFALITELIYLVIFYLITWYVMDKKLNLD